MHFFSLKTNKTPDYDNLIVDIIKKIVDEIQTNSINIFRLSLNTGILTDKSKIAAVSPIFKKR